MAMAIFASAMFGPIAAPDGRVHHDTSRAVDLLRHIPIGCWPSYGFDVHPRPQYLKHRRGEKVTSGDRLSRLGGAPDRCGQGQRETVHSDFILVSRPSRLALLLFVIVELFVAEHPSSTCGVQEHFVHHGNV